MAAAVALNIISNQVDATVPDGLSITADGPLVVTAGNGTGNSANPVFGDTSTASGTAAGTSTVGVGAAVALNLANVGDMATIGSNTTISAQSLTVGATMHQDAGVPETNTFGASATSGAAAGDISVAGSVAIDLVTDASKALIGTGSSVTIGGGDVTVNAQNFSTVTTSAVPASGDPRREQQCGQQCGHRRVAGPEHHLRHHRGGGAGQRRRDGR